MYHKQLIAYLEKDPDYQQLTTNKLNQILYQSGELSTEYILQRTNDKADEVNAPKYKVGPASYTDRSKAKREKAQLELLIKVVDYMIQKFDLEKKNCQIYLTNFLSIAFIKICFSSMIIRTIVLSLINVFKRYYVFI